MDSQVAGRQSNRPPAEIETQLLRLVRGEKLPEPERLALFDALKKQPAWTAWLAEQVKAARPLSPLDLPGAVAE